MGLAFEMPRLRGKRAHNSSGAALCNAADGRGLNGVISLQKGKGPCMAELHPEVGRQSNFLGLVQLAGRLLTWISRPVQFRPASAARDICPTYSWLVSAHIFVR